MFRLDPGKTDRGQLADIISAFLDGVSEATTLVWMVAMRHRGFRTDRPGSAWCNGRILMG